VDSEICPTAADGLDRSALASHLAKLKHIQLPKENMFDKSGQWLHLETFEDFDNGLSDLIELWSSKATQAVKESALAHFKENLEGAMLNWAENRAKLKKYTAIGKELAEFEEVLKEGSNVAPAADSNAPAAPAKTKKKA
jgi:hypothetical protein